MGYYQYPPTIWLLGIAGMHFSALDPTPTAWNFSIHVFLAGSSGAKFYVNGGSTLYSSYTYSESGTSWIVYHGGGYTYISYPNGFYVQPENTSAVRQDYGAYFVLHCDVNIHDGTYPAVGTQGQGSPTSNPKPNPMFFNSVSPGYQTDWTKTESFYTLRTSSGGNNIIFEFS
jgi:hypothetical protein